jgi:hypothetical protein
MIDKKNVRVTQQGDTTPLLPYTINTPLNNYFFYKIGPKIGQPLVGGTVEFFDNFAQEERLDTYSDVSNPAAPVVNTNPIILGSDGSTASSPYPSPVIYLQSASYFIVVKSAEGQVQWTIPNYTGATFGTGGNPSPAGGVLNLLADGQFNWPINFSLPGTTPVGLITNAFTSVSLGCYFLQDTGTKTNVVTFNNIANQTIEGNPQQEIVLSSTASLPETLKDFVWVYGGVSAFQGENSTFSLQIENKQIGTTPITIILEQNFGGGGSATVFTTLGTFQVTNTRDKFILNFIIPLITGKTVGTGNYAAIHLRGALGEFSNFGFTNALMQIGSIQNPIYVGQSNSDEKAQIVGEITDLSQAGWQTDWFNMIIQGGYIYPLTNTGQIITASTLNPPPNGIKLTASPQNFPVTGNINGIANVRLYNAIGNAGSNEIIATAAANVVTVTSIYGFTEFSAYAAGTAPVVVTKTKTALLAGVQCVLTAPNQITVTFQNNFAPNPTPAPSNTSSVGNIPSGAIGASYNRAFGTSGFPAGNQAIIPTVINTGSPSSQCVVNLSFNATIISNYATYSNGVENPGVRIDFAQYNTLEFSSFTNQVARGNYTGNNDGGTTISPRAILISVDGRMPIYGNWSGSRIYTASEYSVTVPFLSSNTLPQNIQTFIKTVANPFIYTILFSSAPTASQYFLFSDATVNYYLWYTVDGVGTDPAVAGRTGVVCAILSTDTIPAIATKTATAMDSLVVTLPVTACPYSAPFADYILQ